MRRLDFLLKTRLTVAHASTEDEISPLRIQPGECFWFVGNPECMVRRRIASEKWE